MTKLIILSCLTAFTVQAQNIKIGDISISEALAKEYFLDCQSRPDTIYTHNYTPEFWFAKPIGHKIGYYCKHIPYRPIFIVDKNVDIKLQDHKLKFIVVSREPSAADFRDWFLRRAKLKDKW